MSSPDREHQFAGVWEEINNYTKEESYLKELFKRNTGKESLWEKAVQDYIRFYVALFMNNNATYQYKAGKCFKCQVYVGVVKVATLSH